MHSSITHDAPEALSIQKQRNVIGENNSNRFCFPRFINDLLSAFYPFSLPLLQLLSFIIFLSSLRSHYIPLYKYPLGDRGEAIFKGRIRIPQHAQLTDSDQICRTIMLGDRARIIAMPTLEITADNVVCR